MGCPFCGGAIPPSKKGRARKFCSDHCAIQYHNTLWQRRKNGTDIPVAHCKNCGRLLKWTQKEFCSPECKHRAERGELQIEGINALRFAAIQQAKKDGALRRWMQRDCFYDMFPELCPDQLRKGEEA